MINFAAKTLTFLQAEDKNVTSCYHFLPLDFFRLVGGVQLFFEHENDIEELLRSISSGLRIRDEPAAVESALRLEGKAAELLENEHSVHRKDLEDSPETVPCAGPVPHGPRVQTKDGILKGLAVEKAYIFYGIPYASPPVGAGRWKPPSPAAPWAGVYEATSPRASCMQAWRGSVSEVYPEKVIQQNGRQNKKCCVQN